jgi:hypothetical protein
MKSWKEVIINSVLGIIVGGAMMLNGINIYSLLQFHVPAIDTLSTIIAAIVPYILFPYLGIWTLRVMWLEKVLLIMGAIIAIAAIS